MSNFITKNNFGLKNLFSAAHITQQELPADTWCHRSMLLHRRRQKPDTQTYAHSYRRFGCQGACWWWPPGGGTRCCWWWRCCNCRCWGGWWRFWNCRCCSCSCLLIILTFAPWFRPLGFPPFRPLDDLNNCTRSNMGAFSSMSGKIIKRILSPRTYSVFSCRSFPSSALVSVTSFSWTFHESSALSNQPLAVSPDFNSTVINKAALSCSNTKGMLIFPLWAATDMVGTGGREQKRVQGGSGSIYYSNRK